MMHRAEIVTALQNRVRVHVSGVLGDFGDQDLFELILKSLSPTHQERVATWARKIFGLEVASNVPERALRFVEEAAELAQACSVSAAELHRLIDYVFARPTGEPSKEVAGSLVTLYALAAALDVDTDAVLEAELVRIHRPEVIERVLRRQQEKREATGS